MVFNTFYNFSNSLMLPTPFFEPVVVGLLWTAWNFVLFLFSQHWLCERLHHLRFSFKNRDIWMRIGCNGSWLGEATRRIFWVSKLPLLLGIFFCLINADTKTSRSLVKAINKCIHPVQMWVLGSHLGNSLWKWLELCGFEIWPQVGPDHPCK